MDEFDQFPDAPAAQQADEFADFPDAPAAETQSEIPPVDTQPDTFGQAVKNVGQAALSLGTGAIATPIAGLAGAVSAPFMGADRAAGVVNDWSSALTFEPRTQRAQGVVQGLTYPLQKLAEGADAVGEQFNRGIPATGSRTSYSPGAGGWPTGGTGGSPLLATGVSTALQSAPALLFRGRANEAPKAVEQPKVIEPRTQLMGDAQKAGLKFTPTQANAKVGSVAEGLTGQAKLERSLSLKNAPVVNKLAAKDLGLPDDVVLNGPKLTELKVKANRAYTDVAKTGKRTVSEDYRKEIAGISDRTGGESFKGDVPPDIAKLKDYYSNVKVFTAEDAVNKIRQLRTDASSNIKARNAPEQNAKGYVQRAIADALDNELARHVETLGKPDLVQKYKDARVQLAKVYSVEDALRGGNVSAKALAQQLKRGAPLSGNLKLVAQTYGEFEKVLQDVAKIRDGTPFGVVDAFMGVAGAAHSLPLTAAVLARPAVRGVLASDRYQRSLAKPSAPQAPKSAPLAKPAAVNSFATDERRRRAR